ncbi:MAG: type II toxin-antitoxin system VapC family toxin [Nitrospirales bacterium]|nr:PIN domain-containing protein [Nitrospirales bacterium]
MSALVVDTSSWVSYFSSSGPSVIDEALAEGRIFLPPVVVAELVSGRLTFRQRADLESFLSDLPLCAVDFEHWLRVGALRAQLSSVGISVSTPDAHIAQCALDLHGDLLSEDGIFLKIAKKTALKLLNS